MDISRSDAHRTIVGEYRNEAAAAAGSNKIISKAEAKRLSPWAQDVVEAVRNSEPGKRIGLERYVSAQAAGVSRELRRVAGEDDRISPAEIGRTSIPELRAKLDRLVGGVSPSSTVASAKAINVELGKLQPVFDSRDDYENPTGMVAISLGHQPSVEHALEALAREQDGAAVGPRPEQVPDAKARFLDILKNLEEDAHASEHGTPEARAAFPAVKKEIEKAFAGMVSNFYSGQRTDPYWYTYQNVLLGRNANDEYLALVHYSATEN